MPSPRQNRLSAVAQRGSSRQWPYQCRMLRARPNTTPSPCRAAMYGAKNLITAHSTPEIRNGCLPTPRQSQAGNGCIATLQARPDASAHCNWTPASGTDCMSPDHGKRQRHAASNGQTSRNLIYSMVGPPKTGQQRAPVSHASVQHANNGPAILHFRHVRGSHSRAPGSVEFSEGGCCTPLAADC